MIGAMETFSPPVVRGRLDRWSFALGLVSIPVTFGFWPAGPILALAAIGLAMADYRSRKSMSWLALSGIALALLGLLLFAMFLYLISTDFFPY